MHPVTTSYKVCPVLCTFNSRISTSPLHWWELQLTCMLLVYCNTQTSVTPRIHLLQRANNFLPLESFASECVRTLWRPRIARVRCVFDNVHTSRQTDVLQANDIYYPARIFFFFMPSWPQIAIGTSYLDMARWSTMWMALSRWDQRHWSRLKYLARPRATPHRYK